MKTPQQSYPELAKALGIPEVWLKREDMHAYGSHKGRSIPLMIREYYKREGMKNFVISSSGNAALAALLTVQKHNQNSNAEPITLKIFIGKHIDERKLKLLQTQIEDARITLEQVDNPKQQAFKMDTNGEAKNLRQSTDDLALRGYTELADELYKIPDLQAVFIPTSSGTTAEAIAENFLEKPSIPQVHIVQTTFCHPMVQTLHKTDIPESPSLATAIVDKIAHRKEKVMEGIQKTNGNGWIVTDEEIKEAMKLVKETCNIFISPNSALSVAGLTKALSEGYSFIRPVVCLLTGK